MFNCNLCSDWRQVGGDIELLDAAGRPAAQPRIGRIVDAALRRHLRRHLGRIAPASGTRTADRRQTRTGQLQAILSRPRSRFLFPPSSLPPPSSGRWWHRIGPATLSQPVAVQPVGFCNGRPDADVAPTPPSVNAS